MDEEDSTEMVYTECYKSMMAILSTIDLASMQAIVNGAPVDAFTWIHWCYTEAADATYARPVGSPCCETHQESVEKVEEPSQNWLVDRAWANGCASRWTDVDNLLRRTLIGCLANMVLPYMPIQQIGI